MANVSTKVKVTGLSISPDQYNEGQLLAKFSWNSSNNSKTDQLKAHWWYTRPDGQEMGYEEQTIDVGAAKVFTYSYPEEAISVRVTVAPVPKQDNNGKDLYQYEWVSASFNIQNAAIPTIPDVPSVTINADGTATYTLTNINSDTDYVNFQTFHSNTTKCSSEIVAVSTTRSCSFTLTLIPGREYKVRARARKKSGVWSDYSEFSDAFYSVPKAVALKKVQAYADQETVNPTTIYVEWSASDGVPPEKYRVEYATSQQYFDDNATDYISSQETDNNTNLYLFLRSGLETGKRYFVRVAAVNSTGISAYSSVMSIVLGSKPAAPTAWSSRTAMQVGESIHLYWVHNATDGSSQTRASVYLALTFKDGTSISGTLPLENTTDLEHIDDTSDLTINTATGEYTWFGVTKKFSSVDSTSGIKQFTAANFAKGGKLRWFLATWGVVSSGTDYRSDFSVAGTIEIYGKITFSFSTSNLDAYGEEDMYEIVRFPIDLTMITTVTDSQKPISYNITVTNDMPYTTIDYLGREQYVPKDSIVYSAFIDKSGTIETQTSSRTVYSLTKNITATDADFQNNIRYIITMNVIMSSSNEVSKTIGVWVHLDDDEYSIGADFTGDPEVLTMSIRPWAYDTSDTAPSDVVMAVYRRNYDSTFTLIGENIPNDEAHSVVDPHPALNNASYRLVAKSLLSGSMTYTDFYLSEIFDTNGDDVNLGDKSIVIQWDENWVDYYESDSEGMRSEDYPYAGSILKLPFNIDISSSNSPDVTLVEYVGRQHPVSYYGTQLGETTSWSTDVVKSDTETLAKIRALMNYMGDVYVREPSGIGFWANIKLSYNLNHLDMVIPVSIDITRVEGGA